MEQSAKSLNTSANSDDCILIEDPIETISLLSDEEDELTVENRVNNPGDSDCILVEKPMVTISLLEEDYCSPRLPLKPSRRRPNDSQVNTTNTERESHVSLSNEDGADRELYANLNKLKEIFAAIRASSTDVVTAIQQASEKSLPRKEDHNG